MNYTYYNNFHHLKHFVKDINNEYLIKFNDNPDFRNQSINLIDLFSIYYPKKTINKYNQYFFDKSNNNSIAIYDKHKDNFYSCLELEDFKDKIYTISLSLDKKIIYGCLSDKKIVKFFYFDENSFLMDNQEIHDNEDINSHFNKCIQLTEKYLATADNKFIKIWKNNNKEQLEIEKKIAIKSKTSDLLLVNDEYFISSQPNKKTIIIININTFEISKTILNVDCIDSLNSLFSLQNFVIINCIKGIQLLFKETREIIQNIENFDNESKNKELYVYNNRLYILDNYSSFIKLSLFEFNDDGFLEKIQEYEKTKIDDNNLKIMVMSEKEICLLGKKMYILK